MSVTLKQYPKQSENESTHPLMETFKNLFPVWTPFRLSRRVFSGCFGNPLFFKCSYFVRFTLYFVIFINIVFDFVCLKVNFEEYTTCLTVRQLVKG